MPANQETVIVVTSDIHGFLEADPDRGRPGLARLAGYLRRLRENYPEVHLLDCGDMFSGHALGGLDGGRTAASLLGRLGYRALTPGNHDFDFNIDESNPLHYFDVLLPIARDQSPVPLVCLAVNLSRQGQPCPGVESRPLVLGPPAESGGRQKAGSRAGGQKGESRPEKTSRRRRIVVCGVANPRTMRPSVASGLPGFNFGLPAGSDPGDAGAFRNELARILSPYDRPGDVVVVLSHLGQSASPGRLTGRDLALIPNAAIVCDGHSHKVCQPTPVPGGGVYLNLGQALEAVAEIVVDQDPKLPPRTRLLNFRDLKAYPEDRELALEVRAVMETLDLGEVLAEIPPEADLSYRLGPGLDRGLGRVVCRMLNSKARADFFLLNPGAVRSGLAGRITKADALETLPFADRVFSAPCKGGEVMDFFRSLCEAGHAHLPYFCGLIITGALLPAGAAGPGMVISRIRTADGRDLDKDALYTLAATGQMTRIMGRLGPGPERPGHQDHGPAAECLTTGLKSTAGAELAEIAAAGDLFLDRPPL
ncbi:MAG: 5'-nucleotidase C-terminal domain-containing protein [Deltaproteobacteria bacterium]|jgi:hypothetical protein|nr:5'-nucleotidase C-terminal domain-containing protein [Deltaproteobacteria bacterium]